MLIALLLGLAALLFGLALLPRASVFPYEALSRTAVILRDAELVKKPDIDGASGIAIAGREEAYATKLWLEGPSAFWLHPEGPLSDTTAEEWLARNRPKEPEPVARFIAATNTNYAARGLYWSYANGTSGSNWRCN